MHNPSVAGFDCSEARHCGLLGLCDSEGAIVLCGKQKAPDQRNRVAQVVGVRARDDAGGRAWLATERLQLTWVA